MDVIESSNTQAKRPQASIWQRLPHAHVALSVLVATLTIGAALSPAQSSQPSKDQPQSIAKLYESFLNPPDASRPMVRWWWFGVAVQKPEILRELRQMKADGIGGVELAFVYPQVLDDPSRGLVNLPFLSPAMLQAVTYAQAEARKLGLRVDVTLCSGWPYGGPSVTLGDAAGQLQLTQVPVPPGQAAVSSPRLQRGDAIVSVQIVSGLPDHWHAASARPLKLEKGTVHVEPSNLPRTMLFFVAGHTQQQVKRAAVGAEGYVLDPFSHRAVTHYLRSVGTPLVGAFGTTPPYAIFSDSLEAYGADWTPDLPAEFLKRRGYDLIPHLAELAQGGSPQAATIRHDYGKTLTELVNQNYLAQMTAWAAAHHTRFRSQTYGTPAVSFSSQNLATLAEGEGPQWRSFSTLRWATSANHDFGHTISSGETFTWLHSPVFRATPLDMKAEADIDLIMGENQFIFHGWPYSPPQVDEPGWSLYAAAALNDHNPWHPVMPYVTKYLSRLSFLMRQGQPANQVAILLPTDDAWAAFAPGQVSVTDAMKTLVPPGLVATILSAGYNVDFTDADAIRDVGIRHQVLILPPTDRIPRDTLHAIAAFESRGGKVIAVGKIPSLSPNGDTLTIEPVCDPPTSHPACHPLFDAAHGSFVQDESHLTAALQTAAVPDLQLANADDSTRSQVGFIRRKLPYADIYLLVNTGNRPLRLKPHVATAYSFGQQWVADSPANRIAFSQSQPIELAPYESRIILFSKEKLEPEAVLEQSTVHEVANLTHDWQLHFTSTGRVDDEHTPADWISSPATIHYSGEVVYRRDLRGIHLPPHSRFFLRIEGGRALPGMPNSPPIEQSAGPQDLANPLVTPPGPGMHAYYDPPIREAAIVVINGEVVGSLWHPPYALDVTRLLKPEGNVIELHIYNTALNAWSALPPHNYQPLIARYGDRFQMQDMDKVQPISSGLLGTVHLVSVDTP